MGHGLQPDPTDMQDTRQECWALDFVGGYMKKSILLAISMAIISTIVTNVVEASNDVEVRGQVTDISIPMFTWNALNFPGFFYDIDENIGTEQITLSLSGMESTSAILYGDAGSD